jgi:hypothetical protein
MLKRKRNSIVDYDVDDDDDSENNNNKAASQYRTEPRNTERVVLLLRTGEVQGLRTRFGYCLKLYAIFGELQAYSAVGP